MPRVFEPEKSRQFYLDLHLQRITKFEPEKTGPFNRAGYMSFKLLDLIEGYLLGLRDQVLPTALALAAWMAAQPHPRRAKIQMAATTSINGGRRWGCASG